MSFSLLSLILMLLGSGGGMNSLLDLTDPETYLKAQGIEYRLEALIGVLEEPAAKDVDVVTSQQVRKLQAMRGLGELKDKAALPVLEKVSKQREMFFDDYALAAMAKIEGRVYTVPTASDADLKGDLALLPEGVGMVLQVGLAGGVAVGLKDVVKLVPDAAVGQDVLEQMNGRVGAVLDKIGNVRIDAVTVGVAENVGDDAGFLVVMFRGKYDHRAVESFMSEQKGTSHHEIGGTMFMGMGGDDVAIAPVSSELLVFVAGPSWEEFPLEKVAAKLKARPAEPEFSDALKAVLAKVDQTGGMWGGGLFSEGMKEVPLIAPFDEIVISTQRFEDRGQTVLKIEGIGKDANAVKGGISQMKEGVEQGIAEMERNMQPGMEEVLKLMKGLKFYSMGMNGTIAVTMDGDASPVIGSVMMMFFGMRPMEAQPDQLAPPEVRKGP